MNNISKRLIQFAAMVIRLLEKITDNLPGKRIQDQLLRSAMSSGANYEEARAAESRADFVHKMQISLKEIREAHYWLCLLEESSLISVDLVRPAIEEARQLRAILSKAVATAKNNAK